MQIDNLSIDGVVCFDDSRGSRVSLFWSANIGFGVLTIYRDNEDGKWRADIKGMCNNEDKDFIRMVLNKWIDDMEVD